MIESSNIILGPYILFEVYLYHDYIWLTYYFKVCHTHTLHYITCISDRLCSLFMIIIIIKNKDNFFFIPNSNQFSMARYDFDHDGKKSGILYYFWLAEWFIILELDSFIHFIKHNIFIHIDHHHRRYLSSQV